VVHTVHCPGGVVDNGALDRQGSAREADHALCAIAHRTHCQEGIIWRNFEISESKKDKIGYS
jgi:hypothetical protein